MGNEKPLRFALEIQFFAEDEQKKDPYGGLIDDSEVKDDADEGEKNADESEAEKQGGTPANDGEDETPKPQDRKTNAEYARRRREAEAKEKAEKNRKATETDAELQGYIKGSGGRNTFLDQPIEDEEDMRLFELMKQADAKGLDPIKEALRLQREERIKAAAEAKRQEERAQKDEETRKQSVENASANIRELSKVHPECDNAWFKEQWKGGKFKELVLHGFTPLQAYEFLGLEKKDSSKKDGTPNLTKGGESIGRKSIKDMTADEYEKYAIEHYGSL